MSQNKHESSAVSRRQVLRIVAVGGIAAGTVWQSGWGFGRSNSSHDASAVSETRTLMGTTVNLTVLGSSRKESQAAVEATLGRMAELEARLSRYRDDSEVGRLNRHGSIDNAGQDLRALLTLGRDLHDRSNGAFDLTVQPIVDLYRDSLANNQSLPTSEQVAERRKLVDGKAIKIDGSHVSFTKAGMSLTLDGIGKGYIVDRAVDELRSLGFANVLVEAGGDLVAAGAKPGAEPWRLGIRRPRSAMPKMLRVDAKDRAIATSGDYLQPFTPDFRLHHILDPRTGVSAPELASSTVMAPNAALADGLATLTMVVGASEGRKLVESMDGCEACFIHKDLRVTRTSGFRTL